MDTGPAKDKPQDRGLKTRITSTLDKTRSWIGPLLLGLLVGLAIGFALSAFIAPPAPKGSPLLRQFTFPGAIAKKGPADWKIIEDRVYEPFPSLSRSPRIARRIIAKATLPDAEQTRFAQEFQQAAKAALASSGAVIKGQFDTSHNSVQATNGSPVRSLLELPRYYYAIDNTHGVADFWWIAESGSVTVIVSFIEGR